MTCEEHNESLPCKYCKTLEHFDNCPIYKKHNQCTCLLANTDIEKLNEITGMDLEVALFPKIQIANTKSDMELICCKNEEEHKKHIANTERKKVTVRPTRKSLKLQISNTKRYTCKSCLFQADSVKIIKSHMFIEHVSEVV